MSRHGYSDDLDQWALIKWRGQVTSAMRGKGGQKLLIDLVQALDAMPEKVLITGDLIDAEGDVCALGAVGIKRGIPMDKLDPEESEQIAEAFDIAEQLAREVAYINDEQGTNHKIVDGQWKYSPETPQERWARVRAWAISHIQPVPVETGRDANHVE